MQGLRNVNHPNPALANAARDCSTVHATRSWARRWFCRVSWICLALALAFSSASMPAT